jgi:hypothetical protein
VGGENYRINRPKHRSTACDMNRVCKSRSGDDRDGDRIDSSWVPPNSGEQGNTAYPEREGKTKAGSEPFAKQRRREDEHEQGIRIEDDRGPPSGQRLQAPEV